MSELDEIGQAYDLTEATPAWRELLAVARDTRRTIEDLQALIASDGLLSRGSKDQVRVHPAVLELRQQRAAYARLLTQLGLEPEGEPETTRQRQARIARKRWQK